MSRCGAGDDALADEAGADQAREADAEDGQRETGRDLVDGEPERQRGEHRATSRCRRQCRTARRSAIEPVQ